MILKESIKLVEHYQKIGFKLALFDGTTIGLVVEYTYASQNLPKNHFYTIVIFNYYSETEDFFINHRIYIQYKDNKGIVHYSESVVQSTNEKYIYEYINGVFKTEIKNLNRIEKFSKKLKLQE